MNVERDELHRMLDEIPEDKLKDVQRTLAIFLDDPVRRALENAPLDGTRNGRRETERRRGS